MRKRREMVLPILLLGLAPLGACEQVDGDGTPIDPGAVEGILEILPREVTLTAIGDTARLNPALKTTSGHRVEPDGAVEWSVTNPQVATVSSDGRVSAKGTGKTTVRGKVGQQVDSVIVVVTQKPSRVDASPETSTLTAVGSTVQLQAQVLDANDTPIPGASISWYSVDPAVAEVSNAGRVTARGEGETRIVASAREAVPDTVAITVKPAERRIVVSPKSSNLMVGDTLRLSVSATDSNGSPTDSPDITWTSLNPEVATVNSTGRVTARTVGTALIVASAVCCGEADTATVNVGPVTPADRPLFGDDIESYAVDSRLGGNGANGFLWSPTGVKISGKYSRSGTRSLYFPFGPTEPNGDSHWWSEQRFRISPDAASAPREVWVEFWVRVPDNFKHNPSVPNNNKLFAIWAEDYNNSTGETFVVLEFIYDSGSGASTLRIASAMADGYENRHPDRVQTIRGTVFDRSMQGKWVRFRIHVRAAVNASIVDVWRDNEKIGELPSDYSIVSPTWQRNYLRHGYILGYDNSRYSEQTDFYVDDFKIYTSDPGWR